MSLPPQAHTKSEAVAVAMLSMPYLVIQTAGRLIGRTVSRNNQVSKPAQPTPASAAPKPQPPAPWPALSPYVVADRVCSATIRGQKVNFYHYFAAKAIRISARSERRLQEALFTPVIAEECGIAYDLDGAIHWIREHGFSAARPRPAPARRQQNGPDVLDPLDTTEPPFDTPLSSPRQAYPGGSGRSKTTRPLPSPTAGSFTHTLVPVDERQGRPFRGYIQFFGEEMRYGRPGEKPYQAYVMKLESESREFTKDFIGEHLSELVQQYELSIGQLVTVQLVAREMFEVEVNGKMEPRRRNHFSIKVH